MTDFETRVREIMASDSPGAVKLKELRKLCAPTTCRHDRLYRIVVEDAIFGPYKTIGWLGDEEEYRWFVRSPNGTPFWTENSSVTVLGEHRPEDEHVGKVYERIEDAVADGMGKYTVLKDKYGVKWLFDNGGISNRFAPFTVLHWAPKEEE